MDPHLHQTRETAMNYLEDHRMNSQDITGGWIVVLIANLAFVILVL